MKKEPCQRPFAPFMHIHFPQRFGRGRGASVMSGWWPFPFRRRHGLSSATVWHQFIIYDFPEFVRIFRLVLWFISINILLTASLWGLSSDRRYSQGMCRPAVEIEEKGGRGLNGDSATGKAIYYEHDWRKWGSFHWAILVRDKFGASDISRSSGFDHTCWIIFWFSWIYVISTDLITFSFLVFDVSNINFLAFFLLHYTA